MQAWPGLNAYVETGWASEVGRGELGGEGLDSLLDRWPNEL